MNLDRYARQIQFHGIGESGQASIAKARILVCGCGALGSTIANLLARAGCGYLRIVDRDFIELNNLQRQLLYDEADIEANLPKAIAAANRLRAINSLVTVEPIVTDITSHNIGPLVDGIDIIADGTDNFETRFLINDAAHQFVRPWVFGGCIGAEGQVMTIIPGETPCFRCLVPDPPAAEATATCDTAGVTGPIVATIAAMQAMEPLKLAAGRHDQCSRELTVVDLWDNRIRHVDLSRLSKSNHCPTCKQQQFEWLEGKRGSRTEVLCGRNAVQLSGDSSSEENTAVDFAELEKKLAPVGRVERNKYLLRFFVDQFTLTIFADGRTVVAGTDDPAEARIVYARYVGH